MSAGRTLHVRCATWEQVEIFHTRKLRRGKLLSMKVPFRAQIGTQVTLGLELPNRVVVAIDGRVRKASPIEGDTVKTWIEIELIGFTEEVLARIRAMMTGAELPEDPTPPPVPVPLPVGTAFADGSAGLAAPPVDGAAAPAASAANGDGSSGPAGEAPADDGLAVLAVPAADELAGLGAALAGVPAVDELVGPAVPAVPAVPELEVRGAVPAARRPTQPPPVAPMTPDSPPAVAPVAPVIDELPALPPLPPPPPASTELPADGHQLFMHLTAELRRLRQLAVHEVLGVDRDADADGIRLGWMQLVRRHHPDLVARHHAPAITHLAEELTILCNRAYDRLRAALVLEGRATSTGSVLQQPAGWLVGFEDISSRGASARIQLLAQEAAAAAAPPPPPDDALLELGASADGAVPSAVQGGEAFESRARMMLSNGDADHAQEVLAAALCVYPRSRPLRSLYYVASALTALSKGERMLATSQLETALAHYEHCVEAAQILEYMRRHALADDVELRRFFR